VSAALGFVITALLAIEHGDAESALSEADAALCSLGWEGTSAEVNLESAKEALPSGRMLRAPAAPWQMI